LLYNNITIRCTIYTYIILVVELTNLHTTYIYIYILWGITHYVEISVFVLGDLHKKANVLTKVCYAVCSNVAYGRVEWLLVLTNTRVTRGGWFCIAHGWWTWRSEQQRWVRHLRTVGGHWTDGGTFNSDGDSSHFRWWRLLCSSAVRVTVELLPLCKRVRDGRSTRGNYILDICMIRDFLESIVSIYLIDSTSRYGGNVVFTADLLLYLLLSRHYTSLRLQQKCVITLLKLCMWYADSKTVS
jgi:hypothetical protein